MATIFETIESLGKIVTDAVTAGNDTAVPARSIRKTLIKVSTGQYREVLPIIVPAECCILGDELRSTNVQPRKDSNSTLTSKSDFKYSSLAIERIENIISDVVEGVSFRTTPGNTVSQIDSWPYAEAPQVAPEAERLARNIKKTIDVELGNKIDAELLPAYELSVPSFGDSRDLNLLNKEFIKAEVIAYLAEEYPNIRYSRTKAKKDIGFVIDSIAYDITYGGNWQSVNAGEAYFDGVDFGIGSDDKQATLDALTYLKALIQTVGRNITVTPVFQTEVDQIPGTGGTQAVSDDIADLMDDIITIIDTGSGTVIIEYPSTLESPDAEVAASDALVAALPEIQERTIDFINENFGTFTFDSAKYRIDFANILEDVAFDVALGTNYNSFANGVIYDKDYNREILRTDQDAIVGAIRYMRDEVAELISSTAATARATDSFNNIVDIIRKGRDARPALDYPTPTGADQDRVDAKNLIQANIDFIIEDTIAYINNQVQLNTVNSPDPASIWFEFEYDEDQYRRELEYLLQTLNYDVLYQGTQAATKLVESYFLQDTTVWNGEIANIVDAYEHLSDITKQVIQEQDVSEQSGNTEIQTTLGSPATATEAGQIESNIDIIQNALTAESLSSVPSISFPDTTWAATEFETAKSTIDTNADTVIVDTIQFVTNEYSGFVYNHAKCSRDLGLIAEAARYDWMLDTNYAGILAAYSYLRADSKKVLGEQKDATLAANEFARRIVNNNVNGVVDAIVTVNATWEYVNDIIWSASSEGNVDQVDFIENYNAVRQLQLNKEFIVQEAKAYVDEYFFDVAVSETGTTQISIADTGWLTANMPVRFANREDSLVTLTDAQLIEDQNYFVKDIIDENNFTISTTIGGTEVELASQESTFTYNPESFRNETQLVIEGSSWDTVLNTNYNAVTRGLAIRRGTAGTDIATQLTETLDGIGLSQTLSTDLRDIKLDVNALSSVNATFNEVLDIVENGNASADALSIPPGELSTTNQQNAVDQLTNNRSFLQAEFIAYLDENYTGYEYNSISFDISSQVNSASAITFNNTGTKFFITVTKSTTLPVSVLEYAVSSAYDISTASYITNYDLSQEGLTSPYGLAFNNDGTQMFVVDDADNNVYQYSLGTGFDLSTVSYDSVTFDTSSQTSRPSSLTFNNDGTKAFIADPDAENVIIYTLSTAFNISTATFDSFVSGEFGSIKSVKFNIDGSRVYQIYADRVNVFNLSTPFDLDTRSSFLIFTNNQEIDLIDIGLNDDGSRIFGLDFQNDIIYQYDLEIFGTDQRSDELGYFVDAISYDIMYGGNSASRQIAKIYTEDNNLTGGSTEQTAIVDGLDYIKTIIQEVIVETNVTELQTDVAQDFSGTPATATEATRAETLLDIPRDIANTLNLIVLGDVEYPVVTWADENLQEAQYSLLQNKEEIAIQTVRYLNKQYSFIFNVSADFDYNEEICARDLREYISAIEWDLVQPKQWERKYTEGVTIYRPGFYKSKLAGRYYYNSVIGSQEEDFFYLRNGTGLRLMSLDGLKGDLKPANEFGTSRPTAGAYASLDPGFGPDDTRVHITARSPYVQNVSTFGFAAVGQKIDGALHNGGNDSIVSNDFTQVISDGIGAWITNNGRAELVSVFTYYAHVGYLAEAGGRVRATNGNNSYGFFGSSAEGVDPEEVPVTASVDNRTQFNATIDNVYTDQNEILQLEFGHAGDRYTEAEIDIFGAGDSEELLADEFRDGAVKQVRIVETEPGTAGGSGFTLVSNTAQTGSTTSLFLAATDGNLSSAYPGMKVYITAGAATGQYGTVYTYDSGSKEAEVVRPTTYTPTSAGSFTTSTIYRIEETGDTDWNSISSETLIDPRPGTIFTATGAGSGTGAAIEMELGWEHVIPGTPISAPNSSSTYQVEPRAFFTAPSNTATAETITSDTYSTAEYFETAAQYNSVATTTNSDGEQATFDVTRVGSKYYVTLNNAGEGYNRLDTVTISGSLVGGVSPLNDISITLTTVNELDGSIVDFDFDGLGQKGVFVIVPSSGNTAQVSIEGSAYSSATLATSASWVDSASGLLDDGSSLLKPSALVIAAADGTVNYSTDAETFESADSGIGSGTIKIAFGQPTPGDNKFLITNSTSTDISTSDDGGANWTIQTGVLPVTGVTALTHGKGRFMALEGGSGNAYYSEDGGLTWTTSTIGVTADWVDVEWGNGRFVAIASDTNVAVYSLDGVTWYQTTLPAGGVYSQLAYGQGVFVATREDDDSSVAYSEDGVLWELFDVGFADTGYNAVTHGNPNLNHQFLIVGSGTDNTVSIAEIGARAQGRTGVANEQLFQVRLSEPGSSYDAAPTLSIFDPNNIEPVELSVRLGNGSIANPTFVARGSSFTTATAEINDTNSNGFADFFQDGSFVAVRRLSARPVNGSNIEFDSLPGQVFKLVNTVSFIGDNAGSFTAFLQLSPEMSITDAPQDGDSATLRIRYSQVRASSHDFLDIGTGNFVDTNYPGIPVNAPDADKETNEFGGGRVFFTATDQDGNFRVGNLFSIEQATGVATLDAEAFNIAGLQELSLGEVTLGGNSAAISEFSTDPFFTANSDNVVPTQRAVKAFIEAQIGGGGASLNVNSVTAGDVFINTNQITTVSGEQINIRANVKFEGAVLGQPLAFNYYLR